MRLVQELFDWATGALSGYEKDCEPKCEKLVTRGRKKRKEEDAAKAEGGDGVIEDEDIERFVPPEEGPLLPPVSACCFVNFIAFRIVLFNLNFHTNSFRM